MLSEYIFYRLGKRRGGKKAEKAYEAELEAQRLEAMLPDDYPTEGGLLAELEYMFKDWNG